MKTTPSLNLSSLQFVLIVFEIDKVLCISNNSAEIVKLYNDGNIAMFVFRI